jgi:multisubunit Na+/H+ antiporter MnhG subunit
METKIEPAGRNPDGSFNLPWGGGTFWLASMTGEAQQVRVEKRNVVHTTTRYESHATSNFDYMSGRFINGSVSVPVNDIHTKTEIESEFWLKDKNGNEKHFAFNHEIVPMKNGQRISVIWGALTGTEEGKYKCIYNHETGDFKTLPRSYSDLGVFRAPSSWMNFTEYASNYLLMFGIIIGAIIGIFLGIINVLMKKSFMEPFLICFFLFLTPSVIMSILHSRLKKSWEEKDAIVKGKVKSITKIIVEYASTL